MERLESSASVRDPLTGAYSRAMFDERLPDEVDRARTYGTPLCLVVFDVDYFKSVNDAFGHSRGDAVLRELVQRVQVAIRSSDILFRYGGDEFAIVLPNTPRDSGTAVAQRVLDAAASSPFLGHPPLSVSLSIGLAVFPDDALAPRPLFECADYRGLQAKRSGRGCVVAEGVKTPSDRPLQESSRLIERDGTLAQAQRFLDRLAQTRRGIMRVTGGHGYGKTRFLAEVTSAARLRNHLVVHLRGSAAAKVRPYGVWREAALTTLPFPAADNLDTVASALEEASAAQGRVGVLVACDDLADFDFATFDLVSLLLGGNAVQRLGVVYTTATRSARTFLGPSDALHEDARLDPLSIDGVAIWLRSTMQWEAPGEFVRWIHEATAGAPGKLQQAILILRERGVLQRKSGHDWALDPAYASTPLVQKLRGPSLFPDRALPPALTDFVGRETEQAQVNALLDRSRLVSLVGPGGIGKTRLALQIARSRAADFSDGVRFVALAPTSDPGLVPSAIARALGARQAPGRTIRESLLASLRDQELLLVLDNFEQVVEASPLVVEILTEAPGVRVLVTSREPLRISGEHVYPVPPLPLPAPHAILTTEEALRWPGVALFVLRAQAVRFDFALTAENARDVVDLCARLDGLPLAIEIAAARVDRVQPRAIAESLASFLGEQGPRDLPLRQRTLHDLIDWSYSMLDRASQRVFARLSVFAGSAGAEAVAAVCDDAELGGELPRVLASLTDKSLVVAESHAGEEPRYVMLGTIRSFAAKALAEAGEEARTKDRHADHFAQLAERLQAVLGGPMQRATLEHFEREYPNLRAALAHLAATRADAAAALALALGAFWERRGHWAEGLDWFDEIARAPALAAALRARCLHAAGRMARLQNDADAALDRLARAGELASAGDDPHLAAVLAFDLGCTQLSLQSDYAAAHAHLTESLTLFRDAGDDAGVADALSKLGLLAYYQADLARAKEACTEALEIAQRRGDPSQTGVVLNVLGLVARARGDYDAAASLLEEYMASCEWLDDKFGMMDAFWNLAEFSRSRGDFERASGMYRRYMALCRDVGNAAGTASAMKDLGELARYRGRHDEAATLYDRALRLLEASGFVGDIPWVQRNQAELAAHRGDDDDARRLYREALRHHGEHTNPMLLLLCLNGLAAIDARHGRFDRAARLVGASERLFDADQALLAGPDRANYEQRVKVVRDGMEVPAFDAARAAGRALPPGEVVTLALSESA
jgi:diguanylate cyclase (GGDEF)-like protein